MIKRDGKLRFWLITSTVLFLTVVIFSAILIIKYNKNGADKENIKPVTGSAEAGSGKSMAENRENAGTEDKKKIKGNKTGGTGKPKEDKQKGDEDKGEDKKEEDREAKEHLKEPEERYTPIKFLDAYKVEHEALIDNSLKMHPYDTAKFIRNGNLMSYEDENYTSRVGIDVSHHQKINDWKKVKEEGIDFAFIRIGARGYGEEGSFINDTEFTYNIENAKKAGIDVGVYFYSQAVNVEEALEEADFVLDNLNGMELDLPVIYDPEHVFAEDNVTNIGRNSKVTKEQFTENTVAFIKKIEAAGYKGGVYANMLWQTGEYDLGRLQEYPMWFADYEPKPQSPYDFEYWQYYNKGRLESIKGYNIDMNIQLIKK